MAHEAHGVDSREAIDRLVDMFRTRLENAVRDNQTVRMNAREGGTPRPLGHVRTEEERRTGSDTDGSFELHVYISARPDSIRLTQRRP